MAKAEGGDTQAPQGARVGDNTGDSAADPSGDVMTEVERQSQLPDASATSSEQQENPAQPEAKGQEKPAEPEAKGQGKQSMASSEGGAKGAAQDKDKDTQQSQPEKDKASKKNTALEKATGGGPARNKDSKTKGSGDKAKKGESGDKTKKEGEEGEEEEEEEEEKPFHFDGEHEYQGVVYPASVPIDILKRVRDFKFRPDDVVITGYPKCGTTWLEHATYLLMHAEKGEAARTMHDLTQHAGFLEVRVPGGNIPTFLEVAEAMEGPRIIRTHLPLNLLKDQLTEAKPKILFALRNPKDCLVSYYHFLKNNEDIFGFYGDFDAFFQMVKEKRLTFGDWFDHVIGWWTMHDADHILFLEFEDMVDDLRLQVQNIVDFLEIDVEDDAIEEITHLCQFKEMAKSPMTQLRIFPFLDADVKRYMRNGKVGDWKEHLSEEQNEYIDELFKQRVKGTALEINFGDK